MASPNWYCRTDDRGEMVAYLLGTVEALARGGAELALFAANTPHIAFDEVAASPRSPSSDLSLPPVPPPRIVARGACC